MVLSTWSCTTLFFVVTLKKKLMTVGRTDGRSSSNISIDEKPAGRLRPAFAGPCGVCVQPVLYNTFFCTDPKKKVGDGRTVARSVAHWRGLVKIEIVSVSTHPRQKLSPN